jgi:Lamin Tail Domain
MSSRTAHALQGAIVVALAVACADSGTAKSSTRAPIDEGDYFPSEPDPLIPDYVEADSGVAIPTRTRDAGSADARTDASTSDAGVHDAGFTLCSSSLPQDLFITELMIASRAGASDDGEWIEIRNTRTCIVKLDGVTVESPRGTGVDKATLSGTLLPGESLVVADSILATANHGIPGKVFSFGSSDVLKNDGDTVRVMLGTTEIDSFTYPKITLTPGSSVSLPSDCMRTDRASILRWSYSATEWTAGFKGTPNAANDDVTCF